MAERIDPEKLGVFGITYTTEPVRVSLHTGTLRSFPQDPQTWPACARCHEPYSLHRRPKVQYSSLPSPMRWMWIRTCQCNAPWELVTENGPVDIA